MRFQAANPAALAYLGTSRQDVVGRSIVDLFPPSSGSALLNYCRWVLQSGESSTFEIACPKFNDRQLRVRAFPYPGGIGLIFTNLTELSGLRRSTATLQAITAALQAEPHACLLDVNVRGTITAAGDDFARMVGFPADQLPGKRLTDVFLPRDRAQLNDGLEQVLTLRSTVQIDTTILRRDQQMRAVSVSMAPVVRDVVPDGASVIVTQREA